MVGGDLQYLDGAGREICQITLTPGLYLGMTPRGLTHRFGDEKSLSVLVRYSPKFNSEYSSNFELGFP